MFCDSLWNSSKILDALGLKCLFCLYITPFRIYSVHDIQFEFSSDFNYLGLTVSEVAFLSVRALNQTFKQTVH